MLCAGLVACGYAQESEPTGENHRAPLLLTVGTAQVELMVPGGWRAQQPHTQQDDSVSVALLGPDPGVRLIVKVKPMAAEVSLDALRTALKATLQAWPGFELTESRLRSVSQIPVIAFTGSLHEDERQLAARVYVFPASGYLWEMTLTAPQAGDDAPMGVLDKIIADLRVRPEPAGQWAKLSCSREALLAHLGTDGDRAELRSPEASVRDLDSCVKKVAIGTHLDENNRLADESQQFPATTPRLIIYLETDNAPARTEITVHFACGEKTILQRRIRLSGSRKFAVTVTPRGDEQFPPGSYVCRVQINGGLAWEIPIQIGN